jgi:hypothetical protein
MDAIVRNGRTLAQQCHHRYEMRILTFAFDEQMQMVLHEHVRKNDEAPFFAGTQDLLDQQNDDI